MKQQVSDMKYQIIYFQTDTYKEKIARSKLRYALPGENIIAMPYDENDQGTAKNQTKTEEIKQPNYQYWKTYFFGS